MTQILVSTDGKNNSGDASWEECSEVLDGCITPTIISPNTTWKLPVRATSTVNVSLSPPPATVDSVSLVDGDRIGLVGQTTSSENGIYKRKSLTLWDRDEDFINGAVAEAGVEFYTQEGASNAGKTYLLQTQGDIDVGTTPLSFVDNTPGAVVLDYLSTQVGTPFLQGLLNTPSVILGPLVAPATGRYILALVSGYYRTGSSGSRWRISVNGDNPSITGPRGIALAPEVNQIRTMTWVADTNLTAGDAVTATVERRTGTGFIGAANRSLHMLRVG